MSQVVSPIGSDKKLRDHKLRDHKFNRWIVILLSLSAAAYACWYFIGPRDPATQFDADYAAGQLSRTLKLLKAKHEPADGHTFLLQANCLRQLGRNEEFQRLLKEVEDRVELKESRQLALALFNIQHGTQRGYEGESPQQLIGLLTEAGALPSDAYSVVLQGMFTRPTQPDAAAIFQQWEKAEPVSPQRLYLQAVFENVQGAADKAELKLLECTGRYAQHELALLALAQLYARPPRVRFEHSRAVWRHVIERFPDNAEARWQLANVERRLGKSALELVAESEAESANLHFERAATQFDLGDYEATFRELREVGMTEPMAFQALNDRAFELTMRGQADAAGRLNERVSRAATALAMGGQHEQALDIFTLAANRTARLRRLQDVAVEQQYRPRDVALAEEANNLDKLDRHVPGIEPAFLQVSLQGSTPTQGMVLYTRFCATCHGVDGNGRGTASVNLQPAARNFRDEPMRLVSAVNRLAMDDDLVRSIRRGVPGTSMPAFGHFTDSEVMELVATVKSFRQAGLREQFDREFRSDSGAQRELERDEWVRSRSHADEPLAIPVIDVSKESMERGRELFTRVGCANCHSAETSPSLTLFDSLGRPVRPPDLARAVLRGGNEPGDIYKRIALGIPGTPHPALVTVSDDDRAALAAYVHSVCQ